MEDELGELFFSSNNNEIKSFNSTLSLSEEFSLSPTFPSTESLENGVDTVTEANDLLENGILVETSKGLVCLSLKDALSSGIAVKDLQNVAAQLLIAENKPMVGDTLDGVAQPFEEQVPYNITDCLFESADQAELVQMESMETPGNESSPDSVKKTAKAKRIAIAPKLTTELVNPPEKVVSKKRGGWPKGRKRKPELAEDYAPKAPATGYVLYLNEKRKLYKDLPFPDVTKLLGNLWSNLSLSEKQVYLDRADVEKKRYREELKAYRQSDAYRLFLNKKRMKKLQGNGTEESDMDATDEIEDEDNEELYCRTCDQWFSSLHNKKEHLYGRQHLQVIAGDFTKERLAAEQQDGTLGSSCSMSTSLDESSLDGLPSQRGGSKHTRDILPDMTDLITRLMETNAERDREINVLDHRLKKVKAHNVSLITDLYLLRERETQLRQSLEAELEVEALIERQRYTLFTVPMMFCDVTQAELTVDIEHS